MEDLLEVRSGPTYYACETNILGTLEVKLQKENIHKVLIVHGKKSWKVAQSYWPSFNHVESLFLSYNGECSDSEIERVSQFALENNVEAIIGVGGGKILDLTKAVGNKIHLDIILIPTLASTCAAWTPLSVIYNDNGSYVRYDIHQKSAWITMVEPRILLDSPIQYLLAGIGDTLAKWYEGNALVERLEKTSVCIDLAHMAAKQCKNVLINSSVQAIKDFENRHWSSLLQQVIETNIVTSGLVGGFGAQYLRVAAAHSIHNGMTTIPNTHHLLHGEKVAYGILVQLVLEEKFDELEKLLTFYQSINLPYTLADIGLTINQQAEMLHIAQFTVQPGEDIHSLFPNITANDVFNAMINLENIKFDRS